MKKQAHLFLKIWEIWGTVRDSPAVPQPICPLCNSIGSSVMHLRNSTVGTQGSSFPKWGSWNPCCSKKNIYTGTWLILLLASKRLPEAYPSDRKSRSQFHLVERTEGYQISTKVHSVSASYSSFEPTVEWERRNSITSATHHQGPSSCVW